MKFNINKYVRVRLTDRGREILRRRDADLRLLLPTYMPAQAAEEDGWSKWQLRDLMSTFGEHIGLGGPVPFETDIEIAVDEQQRPESCDVDHLRSLLQRFIEAGAVLESVDIHEDLVRKMVQVSLTGDTASLSMGDKLRALVRYPVTISDGPVRGKRGVLAVVVFGPRTPVIRALATEAGIGLRWKP